MNLPLQFQFDHLHATGQLILKLWVAETKHPSDTK